MNKSLEKKLSFLYFFRQATKCLSLLFTNVKSAILAGNLDPFYIFGLLEFKSKKNLTKKFLLILPIIFIAIFQLIYIKEIDYSRFIINLFKIFLCINVMFYFKNTKAKININIFAKYYTYLEIIFFIIALIFKNSDVFWRLNDYTNIYDLTRLQLFYLEPSELGFHTSIVIILLFYSFLNNILKKESNNQNIFLLILNIIILSYCKSMGAIAILFVTCLLMLLSFLFKKINKRLFKAIIISFIILFGGFLFFINSGSGVSKRILNVFQGSDNSVNYRVDVSISVFKDSLNEFSYVGCGFGQLNTDNFINRYRDMNLVQMIVNSFIYFWTETGILGIIYWTFLILYILKEFLKNKNICKFGLLIYVLAYQFVGSHFTNGLIWAIYGIIISANDCFIVGGVKNEKKKNSILH